MLETPGRCDKSPKDFLFRADRRCWTTHLAVYFFARRTREAGRICYNLRVFEEGAKTMTDEASMPSETASPVCKA